MSPLRSSLARTVGKLFGVSKDADLSLRGNLQSTRKIVPPLATGGTVTQPGDGYVYHTFIVSVSSPYPDVTPNTSETFKTGPTPRTCDYLIVAGGGAGGHSPTSQTTGGGGGAGGVIYKTGVTLTASTTYPVTVGKGGEAGVSGSAAGADQDGDDSVFNSLTAGGGGAGGRGAGNGESGRNGGCGGGGGAGYPTDARGGGSAVGGVSPHPGSGTDVASPDDGWGRAGGGGAGTSNNTSSGGGGGGLAADGTSGNSDYPPGSAGGDGGIGASYTIKGTAKNIGGGAHAGSYNVAGRTGNAILYGGGHQESDPWNSNLTSVGGAVGDAIPLIYPADQPRSEGLDGTGGGGIGGARGSRINGGSFTTTSSRGGCGFVQIRYVKPS